MEFGIWNLRAASGLWRNAQLMGNSADLPGGNTSLLSLNEFLNSLRPALDHGKCELLRLTTEFSNTIINEDEGRSEENTPFYVGEIKQDNNEYSIEKRMEYLENHRESLRLFESVHSMNAQSNEEHSHESDTASTESDKQTLTSDNNCMKDGLRIFDHPLSPLYGYDRIEANVTPLISGWVLSVYTAMLSRLSGTVPLEVTKISELPSDKDDDFESDNNSSCTEKSRDNDSPTNSIDNRDYPCDKCDVIYPTKSSSKDEIFQDHPISLTSNGERSDANFDRNEENVGTHVVDNHNGRPANSRRRKTMPLQRVRYRYEREEYRCSMCNYACTIEKAFQRHLKAHAKGTAEPTTRLSCAVCGADRSSEVDLSRHMKRHRDDRYFCCDICIFRTVQLKKLIQHRRMHTGEKPHLCPHCAYRSARRDNLRSHVRRVHKKENLYCDTFNPRSISIPPSSPGIPLIGKSHN